MKINVLVKSGSTVMLESEMTEEEWLVIEAAVARAADTNETAKGILKEIDALRLTKVVDPINDGRQEFSIFEKVVDYSDDGWMKMVSVQHFKKGEDGKLIMTETDCDIIRAHTAQEALACYRQCSDECYEVCAEEDAKFKLVDEKGNSYFLALAT